MILISIAIVFLVICSAVSAEGGPLDAGIDIPIFAGAVSLKNGTDGKLKISAHQGMNILGHGFNSNFNFGRSDVGRFYRVEYPKKKTKKVTVNSGLNVNGYDVNSGFGVGRADDEAESNSTQLKFGSGLNVGR